MIETAGAAAAVELATRLVRPGGRVVLLGLPAEGQMVELPGRADHVRGHGSHGQLLVHDGGLEPRRRSALTRGVVDFEPLVTHTFPAERFEDAFALMDARDAVVAKVLLAHTPASA